MRYDLLHPKALRGALIEHMGPKYKVPSERQVRRWVTGDTPWPGWARRATDEIVNLPDTPKDAASSMTRRLLAGVIALERKAQIRPDELSSAEASATEFEAAAQEADARLAGELAASRRKSSGRKRGRAGGQSAGSPSSKRQRR